MDNNRVNNQLNSLLLSLPITHLIIKKIKRIRTFPMKIRKIQINKKNRKLILIIYINNNNNNNNNYNSNIYHLHLLYYNNHYNHLLDLINNHHQDLHNIIILIILITLLQLHHNIHRERYHRKWLIDIRMNYILLNILKILKRDIVNQWKDMEERILIWIV